MNGFSWVAVLEMASGMAELGVQWLVQSTLVLAAGLGAAWILRGRGAAIQSAVYRTTLLATLACPFVAYLLSFGGLTFLTLQLPNVRVETQELVLVPAISQPAPEVSRPAQPQATPAQPLAAQSEQAGEPTMQSFATPARSLNAVPQPDFESNATAQESPELASMAEEPAVEPEMTFVTRKEMRTRLGLAVGVMFFSSVWVLGSLIFVVRLLIDHVRLARVRRLAVSADGDSDRLCRQLAARMHLVPPPVLRTPYVSSPCLAGIVRPTILLPEELASELPAVLVHELAHLARRDAFWNLLRHLAVALLFPQPLVWWLSRRIEAVAEDVCDDHVVHFGTDRHQYATTLLNLAERTLLPASGAVVSLVTLRSLLARRVTRILDHSRRVSVSAGLFAVCMIAAIGASAAILAGLFGPGARNRPEATVEEKPVDVAAAGEARAVQAQPVQPDEDLLTVRGTVLNPDGKPFGGAQVVVARWYWNGKDPKVPLSKTKSDASGEFEISFRKSQFETNIGNPQQWRHAAIAAVVDGYGSAWTYYEDVEPDKRATLKLVPDVPIEGRIVDLEGRPVAGATIHVGSVNTNEKDDLGPWVDAVRSGIPYFGSEAFGRPDRGIPTTGTALGSDIHTDQDGRFRVTGCGRNRVVNFGLTGPGIVATSLHVYTAAGKPFDVDYGQSPSFKNIQKYYPARFEYGVEPSQPIEGVVRDAKTGETLAGVRVVADKFAGKDLSGLHAFEVLSDAEGQYRLDGMPKGEGNAILAMPTDEQPYFMRVFSVPTAPGFEAVKLDLELHRGIWLKGRLTDKVSGKPVHAQFHYLPWPDNPHIQGLPEFNHGYLWGPQMRYESNREGEFKLVGLPGRGLVAAVCSNAPFPSGQRIGEIADLPPRDSFRKVVGIFAPTDEFPTAIHEIRPADDAKEVQVDVKLDPGASVKVKFVDPQGQPLEHLWVRGLWPRPQYYVTKDAGPEVEVLALGPNEKRRLLVHDPKRNLGQAFEITADDSKNGVLTITLQPCATITARLIDANGEPVRGAEVDIAPQGEHNWSTALPKVATDDNGRFNNSAVLPGCKYNINCKSPNFFSSIARDLTVTPGEIIDLGEFDITTFVAKQDRKPAQTTVSIDDRLEFTGKVVDPAGRPFAGSKIYLLYYTPKHVMTKPLGETGADGGFRIAVNKRDFDTGDSNEPWEGASIVATADGYGLESASAASFETTGALLTALRARPHFSEKDVMIAHDRTLHLVKDDAPIEGRILNLEGQGVAGVRVQVVEIHLNRENSLDAWLKAVEHEKADFYQARSHVNFGFHGLYLSNQVSQLFPKAVTDADGRFTLRGIGRERIAVLQIEEPGIETRKLYARTRAGATLRVPGEWRNPSLDTYTFHGAKFDYAAAPSRPVIGVIRDNDTLDPLEGVTIEAEKLAGERISGWPNGFIQTKSDAEGRYRLEGLPLGENLLLATKPGEEPYVTTALPVETTPANETATLDFKLKRGVWIRGRVTDAETGAPLRGRVEYFVFNDNSNRKSASGLMRALGGFVRSDVDGRFAVPGLPGRGLVSVMADNSQDYPRGAGADDIEGRMDKDGMIFDTSPYYAVSLNANSWVEVNPADDAEAVECVLVLKPGKRLEGTVLDPEGKPLAGAMFAGGEEFRTFRSQESPTFIARNLKTNQPRRLQFYHQERKLAGSLLINGDETGPLTVKLEPWAVVTGRVLAESGSPADNVMVRGYYKLQSEEQAGILPDQNFVQTDDGGRFRVEGLAAGIQYSLSASKDNRELGVVGDPFTISAGETKDLGDLVIKPSK